MKRSPLTIWVFCAIAVLLQTFLQSCSSSTAGNGKDKRTETSDVFVKVEKVALQDFSETIRLTGSIESQNNITVPAEEGGRVVSWKVPKGGFVRERQVLVQLDDAMLLAAFESAQAGYHMADVNYQKQKAAFEEKAVSELQVKNLEYQREAAKAASNLAKIRLEKATILSPISGILNNRFVDEGEMIGPGMPIAQVIDLDQLKVTLGVPERYSRYLRIGLAVNFTVDAFPGEIYTGTVSYIAGAVNPDNRSLPIEINFPNRAGQLKPQMIAAVELRLQSDQKAILISQDFIQQIDLGKTVVYVFADGVAQERVITLGGIDGSLVRVTSGLKEGDQLITVGFQNLIDRQKVTLQQ